MRFGVLGLVRGHTEDCSERLEPRTGSWHQRVWHSEGTPPRPGGEPCFSDDLRTPRMSYTDRRELARAIASGRLVPLTATCDQLECGECDVKFLDRPEPKQCRHRICYEW